MSTSLALKVSIEGTLNVGREELDSLADHLLSSLGSFRRSLLAVREDKITSVVQNSLHELTKGCENCLLYVFIEEYITVLARAMCRVLKKALGVKFIKTDYENQVKGYAESIKEVLLENTDTNPSFWIVIINIINSKFQQLIPVYCTDPIVDKNLRHKIVLATVIMENNYLNILCVEHDVCLTEMKFTYLLLAVLTELTEAADEKIKTFLNSFFRALHDTKLYSLMKEDFAHQVQLQLYEFAENPNRNVLVDFHKIVADHANRTSTMEKTPRHVDLIHAILTDLDIVYVVQSGAPFTEFLEGFHLFLKSDDDKLDVPKLLLEIQSVVSALANEIFHKLYNQVYVLLDILLSMGKSMRQMFKR